MWGAGALSSEKGLEHVCHSSEACWGQINSSLNVQGLLQRSDSQNDSPLRAPYFSGFPGL